MSDLLYTRLLSFCDILYDLLGQHVLLSSGSITVGLALIWHLHPAVEPKFPAVYNRAASPCVT